MTEMIVPNGHQIAVYESCNQSTFFNVKTLCKAKFAIIFIAGVCKSI